MWALQVRMDSFKFTVTCLYLELVERESLFLLEFASIL